jgi:hypothetical protein
VTRALRRIAGLPETEERHKFPGALRALGGGESEGGVAPFGHSVGGQLGAPQGQ